MYYFDNESVIRVFMNMHARHFIEISMVVTGQAALATRIVSRQCICMLCNFSRTATMLVGRSSPLFNAMDIFIIISEIIVYFPVSEHSTVP